MTDHDDDRLLDLLGQAMAATEPVPSALTDDAQAVFTWRTIDAELLALGFDSAVDELAGVRSASTTARLLRFGAGEVEVEVDVLDGYLDGVVVGTAVAKVSLERPNRSVVNVDVDEHGRFRFLDVSPGPVRFRLGEGAQRMLTEWFLV